MAAPCRSSFKMKLILQTLCFVSFFSQISSNPFKESDDNLKFIDLDTFPVSSGNTIIVKAPKNGGQKLCVLCYPGQDKRWYRLWTYPKLFLSTPNGKDVQYEAYYGDSAKEVVEKSESTSYLPWPSLPFYKDQFAFYPFNASCVGISSKQPYILEFTVKNPYLIYVAMTLAGLIFIFCAKTWSGNIALHYSVGVSVGVLGSVLIAVFIILKFLPEKLKTLTYIVGAVSTSVSLYLYQYVGSCLNHIVANNWKILCVYVLVSGLISFAVVYRYGPVTNTRSLDLVCWVIQGFGLVLLYNGSQIPEMAIALIIMALAAYHIPHRVWPMIKQFRYRHFPPQRRFLTEEEYRQEADLETKKALEDLRQFCQSPDCNAWKTVSRLATPNKFAKFMEGDSHVSDQEFEVHLDESEMARMPALTDEEEEDSCSDGEEELVHYSRGVSVAVASDSWRNGTRNGSFIKWSQSQR